MLRWVFLLAACSVQALVPMDLQVDGVRVTATAECDGGEEYVACLEPELGRGVGCSVRACGREGDGAIAHNPELAVDGDVSTSWQSPPQSFYQALGEDIGNHNLTVDLGRSAHVVEVQVWSGEGELPARVELYLSLDGATFTLVDILLPAESQLQVMFTVLWNITTDQQELTIEQRAISNARYLRLHLVAPPTLVVPSEPRSAFYSVSEVGVLGMEEGPCPPVPSPPGQCYGEAVERRTHILLSDPALHRLLWQRANQSDVWVLDDVMVILDRCLVEAGGCDGERVSEDFNGTLNSLLWDSDSFPTSTTTGPRSCPHSSEPSLLVPPGDRIISRPLLGGTSGVIFNTEFPSLPPFCRGDEYSPVEVRLCRSIEGVLGECHLLALVSGSDCGNCLDQLTSELRSLQESLGSALFPVDLSLLDQLHTDIHTSLDELESLEGLLAVLEVVLGTLPSLPPSILPLYPSVPRLDLQLVPTILSKLQQLRELLEQMPTISVVSSDDLVVVYSAVRSMLENLLIDANQLRSDQRALSSQVKRLLRSISKNAEAISVARETANQIVMLISSRQYSNTEFRVQMLGSEIVQLDDLANRFLGLAQSNSLQARDISSGLVEVSGALVDAGNLVTDTVGVALNVLVIVRETETLEQALMNEAIELLEQGDNVLAESEVAVATGEQLLSEAMELYLNSTQSLPEAVVLLDRLNQSVQFDRSRLESLVQTSACSSDLNNCTAGEEHGAELAANHTYLINSSVSLYTRRHAMDTLVALETSGMPLDISLINTTAAAAWDVASDVLDRLSGVNTTLIEGVVSRTLSSARQLTEMIATTSAASTSLLDDITSSDESQLESRLSGQQIGLSRLSDRIGGVVTLDPDEAIAVLERANDSVEVVRSAGVRVERVRVGTEEVREDIPLITSNVQSAQSILQDTEQQFSLVNRLLTATQRQAQAALSNVTSFIADNDRIVSDIDELIASLANIHSSIGMINSPVRLSSEPAATEDTLPYLSLQPPPGRQLEGVVQFENLDLYMWPSAQYQTPNLIFYAGPIRFPNQQNGTQPEPREDLVWVIAEEDQLRLGWELGGYHDNITYPGRLEGESQLQLTRVGSQFRLQFSPSNEEGIQVTSLVNDSLLFHSSRRTAFLLGGWPSGAQLGSEVMPLPLSSLRGFEGQFQLALFNGVPWGLWNVRSTSVTDLIGEREFRRNEFSRDIVWHANAGFLRAASTLSFDGSGFLFTGQFGTVTQFAVRAIFQTIMVFLRPNDVRRGLAMYAYQPQESVSVEVFFRGGRLNVLISRHDDTGSEVIVNYSEIASTDEEMEVRIQYVLGNRQYIVNGEVYRPAGSTSFFTNLRQTRAWFGGVRTDQLESTYIPHEMTGYFGCVDLYVQRNFDTLFEILRGPSFTENYLNSPLQSRLSATCYATVYAREVSFEEEAEGLAYTYLPLPPRSPLCPSLFSSLSLSVLPLNRDGVILAARDQGSNSDVVIGLRSGVLVMTFRVDASSTTITLPEPLQLGVWHHLLLSLSPAPSSQLEPQLSVFVDGHLLQEDRTLPTGFTIDLLTSAPVDPVPLLFVGGGMTFNLDPPVPTFHGCLRDLTFGLCPLNFQAPSVVVRNPPGVSYHSCPAATIVTVPELPVLPALPEQRVCLGAGPVELGSTHGGFARDTRLETSNVVGLWSRQWTLTFGLRQCRDGHVISVRSVSGVSVMVEVVSDGRLQLTVSRGSEVMSSSLTTPLPRDVFTPVAISCEVLSPALLCNLTVGAGQSVMAEVAVSDLIFDPALPLTMGYTQDQLGDMVDGFEGCVRGLAINGDEFGFRGVETGVPCYNQTEVGLGFTGISRISQLLPAPSSPEVTGGEVMLSLTLRALLETGVILTLTEPLTTQLLLAVGLVQGELRVSGFSGDYITVAEGLCNPDNEVTFELTVNYTESRLLVGVARSEVTVPISLPPPLPVFGELVLTVGNIPEDLPSTIDLSFLVSEATLPAVQPAGLAGCVVSSSVLGTPLSLSTAENILNGFCPDG